MKSPSPTSARLFVAALLLFASANLASARNPHFRGHRPPPKPVYTAITAVDPATMSITTAPKNSTGTTPKTYKYTADTKITLNGNPATVADLKPGMRVRLGLGASDDVAEELSLTKPPGDGKSHKHPRYPAT